LKKIYSRKVSDDLHRQHTKRNFIFAKCFMRAHFLFAMEKNWNVSPKRLFQQERQSCEQRAQLGMLVGLLLAMTGLAASAKLKVLSSASPS
jgi:hypothetical protein